MVGDVVNIGAGRSLTDGVYDKLAVYSRLRHLARSIDIGNEDGVRKGESLTKLAVEGTSARIAVRLKDCYDPPLG